MKFSTSLLFICVVVVVILLWLISPVIFFAISGSWEERGQIGDSFGGVNALFSGLAFAGLVFTIYMQREELGLQRKELELTREQLSRAAAAQERSETALTEQVEAMRKTAFLNALNSLIQHYEIKINQTNVASEKLAAKKQQVEYVKELEELLIALK